MARLDKGSIVILALVGALVAAGLVLACGPGRGYAERLRKASSLDAAAAEEPPPRPADVGDAEAEALLRNVERPSGIPSRGLISFDDDHFCAAYDELYDHRDAYYGREIELSGYVERQDALPEGQFLIGRQLMWCCANDMYFIGFLVLGSAPVPPEGAQLKVRGRIESAPYTDPETGKSFAVPAIRAVSVDAAHGVSEYVFPSALAASG